MFQLVEFFFPFIDLMFLGDLLGHLSEVKLFLFLIITMLHKSNTSTGMGIRVCVHMSFSSNVHVHVQGHMDTILIAPKVL